MGAKRTTSSEDLSREERINREKRRLASVFRDLDANKRKVVKSLIENAAFMAVALEDLQKSIAENGYSEEYQNGKDQSGMKETPEVKTHLAMTKNQTTILKTLADMAPPAPRKKSKLQELRDSVQG